MPGRRLAAAVGRALLRGVPHRAAGGADGDGPPFRAGAQAAAAGAPGLVLLEYRRGGKPGLRAEPTLLLYGPDGRETAEHRRAYFREEEQAL